MYADVTARNLEDEVAKNCEDEQKEPNYQLPNYNIDKCNIVKAVYYDKTGKKSDVAECVYFIGFEEKEGYENVNIIYDPGYGIGASCVFEDIAKIEIRSREPNHAGIPHVHVYKKGKENESISILLTSFEVIPKCEREWNKYYSSNERNLILDFLKVNKEKLSEFYDRCNKGEYITEDYILAYNGKQYDFYVSRTY